MDLWAPAGIKQITQKLQYRIRRGNERCDLPAGQFTVKMQPPKTNLKKKKQPNVHEMQANAADSIYVSYLEQSKSQSQKVYARG